MIIGINASRLISFISSFKNLLKHENSCDVLEKTLFNCLGFKLNFLSFDKNLH